MLNMVLAHLREFSASFRLLSTGTFILKTKFELSGPTETPSSEMRFLYLVVASDNVLMKPKISFEVEETLKFMKIA